jgi:hypothetical protein
MFIVLSTSISSMGAILLVLIFSIKLGMKPPHAQEGTSHDVALFLLVALLLFHLDQQLNAFTCRSRGFLALNLTTL